MAVKSLYPPHHGVSNDGRTRDDFAKLNTRNMYGGSITRESVHEAVVMTKKQRPSQDIVVLGASWQ